MNLFIKLCLLPQTRRIAKLDKYYAELKQERIASINADLSLLYRQREAGCINLYGKTVTLVKPRITPSSLVD